MPVGLAIWLGDIRVKLFLAVAAILTAVAMLLFIVKPFRPPIMFTRNGHSYYCYNGRRGCWPITEQERRRIEENRARRYRP